MPERLIDNMLVKPFKAESYIDDLQVIKLTITECEVSQILLDTESSVNVIFKDTLRKMDIDESDISLFLWGLAVVIITF